MNGATDDAVRADLRALPGHLDRIDAWLADGTLGTDPEAPNAADLQIGATSRLLLTIGDVLPSFDGRAARAHALRALPRLRGLRAARRAAGAVGGRGPRGGGRPRSGRGRRRGAAS